jgi:hypothetical protein
VQVKVAFNWKIPGRIIHNHTETSPHEVAGLAPSLRCVDFVFAESALPHLHTVTADYFSLPIEETFNWDEVAERLGTEWEGEWISSVGGPQQNIRLWKFGLFV